MEIMKSYRKVKLAHKKTWYFLGQDGVIERKAKNNIDILEILEDDSANAILCCEIILVDETDGTQITVPQFITRKDMKYKEWIEKMK